MFGNLGERLFFGLLGATREVISHHTRHREDPGLPPVPDVGPGHRFIGHRGDPWTARVPVSFRWEGEGRRQYLQGYDEYGNPV